DGAIYWRSVSSLGVDLSPELPLPAVGQRVFSRQQGSNGEILDAISQGIVWTFDDNYEQTFVFSVAVSRHAIEEQLSTFRRQLYIAFFAVAVALLIATWLLLSWLLRPLGRIAREIESVETGSSEKLSADYPSELTGVARNLNTLLDSEQKRVTRYQQTLANLAHSLKTPLAAAKSLLAGRDTADVGKELDRMEDIVRYQLSRPAAAGGRLIGRGSVAVEGEIHDLLDGLDKVYREKRVSAETDIETALDFFGDRGDLVEMAGNLLDNAYKWCDRRVHVTATSIPGQRDDRNGIMLAITDDGAGIPAESATSVLARGRRLDEATPGSGIGLSVVAELAALYGGDVAITRSERLGGAKVVVTLPGV
ncbi:MAG: ATP-binding protein, partial [Pseudomonadota bacterium]